jgi:hypothetical protein
MADIQAQGKTALYVARCRCKVVTGVEKRTLKEDQANFKWLDGYLGHKVLAEIDQTDIDRIITAKLNEGVSNARVNRITALVSAVLNISRKDWGWIDFVPPIRKFAEPKKRIR